MAWLKQQATAPELSPTVPQTDRLELERQLADIDAGLVKNRVEYDLGEYGIAMRNRVETALLHRQAETRSRVSQRLVITASTVSPNAALNVADHWDDWSAQQRNEALRLLVTKINVLRLPGARQRSITVTAA